MTRKKSPHLALPGKDAELDMHLQRQAIQQEMQKAQSNAINAMVLEAGQQIYSGVMSATFFEQDLGNAIPKEMQDICRGVARFAKIAAPFYAEAYGFVSVPDVKEEEKSEQT